MRPECLHVIFRPRLSGSPHNLLFCHSQFLHFAKCGAYIDRPRGRWIADPDKVSSPANFPSALAVATPLWQIGFQAIPRDLRCHQRQAFPRLAAPSLLPRQPRNGRLGASRLAICRVLEAASRKIIDRLLQRTELHAGGLAETHVSSGHKKNGTKPHRSNQRIACRHHKRPRGHRAQYRDAGTL